MELIKEFDCKCGHHHDAKVESVEVGKGVIEKLPEYVEKYGGKKVFIFADINTFKAGGEKVVKVLEKAGVSYSKYVFNEKSLEPDEYAVGSAIMNFDKTADIVIGVGSGVINDISKIVAGISGKPYFIVGTAPSMDGYASATSSMSRGGLKVSLPSKCANVVFGDTDILKTAPLKMVVSGLGDMLAKYVSICEWRISNLINGEYYCEEIANIIRTAVKECLKNPDGLLHGDEEVLKAVFSGLVLGGVGMNYAGCSRPASGVEHYFSHVWDMRGLEFKTAVDFHGIQCAIGTLYAIKIYENLIKFIPDEEKALNSVKSFDYKKYSENLREFLGRSAESMIKAEEKDGKYDIEKHKERLKTIIAKWDKIVEIIKEELIPSKELEKIMDKIGAPKTCDEIGVDKAILKSTFNATKDIRDKYVLSRLCFDLGVTDEVIKGVLE